MKPSDLVNVGAWRRTVIRTGNIRKTAASKQTELVSQLRDRGNNANDSYKR